MLPAAGGLERLVDRFSPAREERRRLEEGQSMMSEDTRTRERYLEGEREYAENELMKQEDTDASRGLSRMYKIIKDYRKRWREHSSLPDTTARDKAHKVGLRLKLSLSELKDIKKAFPLLKDKDDISTFTNIMKEMRKEIIKEYGRAAVGDL